MIHIVGPSKSLRLPGRLASRDIEPVEQIDERDVQHQRRQPAFIEVLGGRLPDLIGHRIRTVVQSRHALGERQRGVLVSGEPRRVVPSGYRQQPVVQRTRSQLVFDSSFYTRAAPVDLAGTRGAVTLDFVGLVRTIALLNAVGALLFRSRRFEWSAAIVVLVVAVARISSQAIR